MKKILLLFALTALCGSLSAQNTGSGNSASRYEKRSYPHYQGEISVAFGVGVGEASQLINTNRIVLETVHGARINPYLFVGAGLGYTCYYSLLADYNLPEGIDDSSGMLPVFADFKGYYPVSNRFALYMAFDFGAAMGVSGLAEGTEFYTALGPGITLGNRAKGVCGDFGIRFQHMGTGTNAFLFRIGLNF